MVARNARNASDRSHRIRLCYLLAALILVDLAVLSRSPMAGALPCNLPSYVTPLAVILGLVIAFLASRVWANVDRAQGYVVEEASGIRQAILMSAVLPPDTRDALRKEIGNYLRFVDQVDSPAMLRGQEGIRQTPQGAARCAHDFAVLRPAATRATARSEPRRSCDRAGAPD